MNKHQQEKLEMAMRLANAGGFLNHGECVRVFGGSYSGTLWKLSAVRDILLQMTRDRGPHPREWEGVGPITYTVDANGKVSFRTDLSDIIDGADITRIRECARCGKVFYAARKLSTGCSPKCANALRARRKRKRAGDRRRHSTKKKGAKQ